MRVRGQGNHPRFIPTRVDVCRQQASQAADVVLTELRKLVSCLGTGTGKVSRALFFLVLFVIVAIHAFRSVSRQHDLCPRRQDQLQQLDCPFDPVPVLRLYEHGDHRRHLIRP